MTTRKAPAEPLLTPALVDQLLDRALGRQADLVLRERFLRTLLESAVAGAQRVAQVLDIPATVGPSHPVLQRLATDRIPQIVGINETTRIRIRDALAVAVANGENLPGQIKAIQGVFQEADKQRSLTIARTENAGFWNGGAHRQMSEGGVMSHLWLTSRDSRVRESHVFMEGQCRPIGEAFDSGDGNKLLYPGDNSAPPSDTINCRCAVAPKVDPCGSRSAWLSSYGQRTIYWKAEIRQVEARERVARRVLRWIFREQREAVVAAAQVLVGQ